MKIQDLRDDLAEMRYFKKSHLRKMSQQEAGDVKPVHPFPNPYQFPPEVPAWANPRNSDPDGDGVIDDLFSDNPAPPSDRDMDILQVFIDNLHRIM